MQGLFHAQQLVAFAFQQLGDRNAGPARHHLTDFVFGHGGAHQPAVGAGAIGFRLLRLRELPFQLRDAAVLELRHALPVTGAACRFDLLAGTLQFFLDAGGTLGLGLLGLPALLQIGVLALQFGDFLVQLGETALRGFIGILLDRFAFDLELDQAPFQAIHDLRLGIDFYADAAGGLVDQINGLVR